MRELTTGEGEPVDDGLIVSTIRMGYGHHRIAAAASSWGLARPVKTHLHDLLSVATAEAESMERIDRHYSRLSRLAADLGGAVNWAWGKLMSQGGLDSLRLSCAIAEGLSGALEGVSPDVPFLASYPLNGQIAVARGFRRVINLVVDYHPQHFLLVPGAMNLLQGPNTYRRFREMGVPSRDLEVAGHWVHHDIISNLTVDCEARIRRLRDGAPLTLLIPVGGAGGQRAVIDRLLEGLRPLIDAGRLRVYVNCGDHDAVRDWLGQRMDARGVEYRSISDRREVDSLRTRHLEGAPVDGPAVTLFSFDNHYDAFSTTDQLVRIGDIMANKPSELAFIPVPKVHLRRVGDHEAPAAIRSSVLGDGTLERRTAAEAIATLSEMVREPDCLLRMNEQILENAERGVYDGARRGVEHATSA